MVSRKSSFKCDTADSKSGDIKVYIITDINNIAFRDKLNEVTYLVCMCILYIFA